MNLMNWEKCKKEFIRKVEIDGERVSSILKKVEGRLKKIEKYDSSIETSFIIEDYYEAIKELLIAYLLKHGLRSKNHQCLISFFYINNKNLENEANLISQLSYYRNRLDYYGETIPDSFYKENKENIIKIINLLKELIKKC